ncbi:MAG: hypothetical protein MUF18_11870 [Fimbriiglobus sp.]|nr:hypothetical protein [Fimbriiglobus sp.]
MNCRPLLVTAVLAALAAWVSAQPGHGPTAAEMLKLLETNRGLYTDLARSALELSDANTSLDRADRCRRVAERLAREARQAVESEDADRLAEVSDHLHAVSTGGLADNLADARREIAPASEDYKRLLQVHRQAFDSVSSVKVPADGELGRSKRAQAAKEKLSAAAARLGPPPADR